jgi:hypothetical protein
MALTQVPLRLSPSIVSSSETTHCSHECHPQFLQIHVAHPELRKTECPSASVSAHSSFCVPALRSNKRTQLVKCRATGDDGTSTSSNSGDEGGDGFEVDKALDRVLQSEESAKLLDSLAEKALQDEDSKALLKEFATAAERVARVKQELESIENRERDLADIMSKIVNKAVSEENEIANLVRLSCHCTFLPLL